MSIDGENFDVAGDLAYDATIVKREELDGQSGFQGYTEMPKAGMISAKIRDAGNMTVALFMQKVSSSVVLRLANGKTVSGDAMACIECSEVATQEASFSVKFIGQTVTENPL